MSWRVTVTCVHSDVIRALDAEMPNAVRQGANPDLFHAISRAAAAVAQHVGRGPQHGGVAIDISGHADAITNFSIQGWDVKAAGAIADKERAKAAAKEAKDQADAEAEAAAAEAKAAKDAAAGKPKE